MTKYFGTDGIRGVANEVLNSKLAYDTACALSYIYEKNNIDKKNNKITVCIGTDTRISKDMLKSSMIAGFNSSGVDVIDLGVVPTPAVAYLTRFYNADAGVVISASHNPAKFNGIKIFNKDGFKLADEYEIQIEDLINNPKKLEDIRKTGEDIGQLYQEHDRAKNDYIDFLISTLKNDIKDIKVSLDAGNGASYEIARELFERIGLNFTILNYKPNGLNINKDCGSTNPTIIQNEVLESKSDIGFSYDGDADRVIACDDCGNIIDGDSVLAFFAKHMKEKNKLPKNAVVGTVMSNIGLEKFLKTLDINLYKANVGDKNVLECMLKEGIKIGAEQSGHIIFLEDNTTGDGLLSSLKILDLMAETKEKSSTLNSYMRKYPQVLLNAKVCESKKRNFLENEIIKDEIKKLEDFFKEDGRVLVRASGTEPLVRVMIEGVIKG